MFIISMHLKSGWLRRVAFSGGCLVRGWDYCLFLDDGISYYAVARNTYCNRLKQVILTQLCTTIYNMFL